MPEECSLEESYYIEENICKVALHEEGKEVHGDG